MVVRSYFCSTIVETVPHLFPIFWMDKKTKQVVVAHIKIIDFNIIRPRYPVLIDVFAMYGLE